MKAGISIFYLGSVILLLLVTMLIAGACTAQTTPTTTATTTSTTQTAGQSITIDLSAQNLIFDKSTITVPASADVTINFDNKDSEPHNFALYETSSLQKSFFIGQIISTGTIEYRFTAPANPGTYFFRCDVHPNMNGSFIVQ